MNPRKWLRICVDIAMAGLLLFLMSYPLTRGLFRHGICGLAIFLLFICHHVLNKHWRKNLFKGSFTWRETLLKASDIILLAITLGTFISSMLLCGEVFPFAPFPMTWWARSLHNCMSAWLFAFAGIHLGLHWRGPWINCRKVLGRFWLPASLLTLTGCLFPLYESGLLQNMFLFNNCRKIPQSEAQFFGRYALIALSFYIVPNLLLNGRINKRRSSSKFGICSKILYRNVK